MIRYGMIGLGALCVCVSHGLGSVQYSYDDGIANVNVGPPSSFDQFPRTDMIWGNSYSTQAGGEIIESLSFQIGSLVGGSAELEVFVYDDPTNDADPTDITGAPLSSVTMTFTDPGFGLFVDVALPTPVTVSGDFFIGAALRMAEPGEDAPGALDPDNAAFGGNSWLMYSPNFDSSDLAGSIAFSTQMNNPSFVPVFGAWAFRANAVPGPGAIALGLVAAPMLVRRRRA